MGTEKVAVDGQHSIDVTSDDVHARHRAVVKPFAGGSPELGGIGDANLRIMDRAVVGRILIADPEALHMDGRIVIGHGVGGKVDGKGHAAAFIQRQLHRLPGRCVLRGHERHRVGVCRVFSEGIQGQKPDGEHAQAEDETEFLHNITPFLAFPKKGTDHLYT